MTDAELRDAAVAELEATTISYPTWLSRVENGYKGKPYDPAKTSWGRAFAHLALIESVAPPPPLPTGDPIPANGRITRGGVYSGSYTGATIVLDTAEMVRVSYADITNTGGDMFRGLGGGFTIKNLTLDHVRGICQCGVGQGRRIFDVDGAVESITVRNCTFEKATGMKLSGPMPGARILVERTRLHNPMGDPNNTTSQFVQLNAVSGASVELAWFEVVCDDPNSFMEDIISISGNGAYVHDGLLDGQWAPGNPESTSQGGITVEEGASSSRIEDMILVATVGGITLNPNIGPNNVALRNRVVRSGLLPDGVTRSKVGYSGLVCFPGSPGQPPQNGNHAHGHVVGFMMGSKYGNGRMDWEGDDLPADCLPQNTHLSPVGGQITQAHEQAERDRHRAKLSAAGVTVGA